MALIDKEVVLTGKGYVFINGIPFAYASGFELKADFETSTLARSHASAPDRIFHKGSTWTLTIPVKEILLKKHYGTLFTVSTLTEPILKAVDVDGYTDDAGSITFAGVIPIGYSLANISSVPLIVSTTTSKFDLYVESATVSGGNVSFSGLPANAKVKAYLVLSKDGEKIRFSINSRPVECEVEGMFIDPFSGQVGIKVFKAVPKNLSFTGLGDDFVEQTLEFDVLGDETGRIADLWLIE